MASKRRSAEGSMQMGRYDFQTALLELKEKENSNGATCASRAESNLSSAPL